MPTIVFACKSNSCRSQMAEAWARRWIEEKIHILDETLSEWEEENEGKEVLNDEKWTRRAREHIAILKKTIVASVALDSSSVFSVTSCDGDGNSNSNGDGTCGNRKQVKSKAVAAMKEDGVDISSFKPKTIEEILPLICPSEDEMPMSNGRNSFSDILVDGTGGLSSYEHRNHELNHQNADGTNHHPNKPVDKLIVLCSCGDSLKYKLARRSKSVEEWSIDAPTAAAKNGEGDKAYRRVSMQIRSEIKIMMESLLGESCY